MCVERIHRFMMALVLSIGAGLMYYMIPEGIYVIYFVIFMLVVYGLTNVCPSVWMMEKLGLKKCGQ